MRLPSLALVLPLLASLALGCGASAVRIQATAIEASALALHTTGDIVTEASYRDARSTCPDGSPVACLDPVSARWEPVDVCLLYTSPSPRDLSTSRMPSSA